MNQLKRSHLTVVPTQKTANSQLHDCQCINTYDISILLSLNHRTVHLCRGNVSDTKNHLKIKNDTFKVASSFLLFLLN